MVVQCRLNGLVTMAIHRGMAVITSKERLDLLTEKKIK